MDGIIHHAVVVDTVATEHGSASRVTEIADHVEDELNENSGLFALFHDARFPRGSVRSAIHDAQDTRPATFKKGS